MKRLFLVSFLFCLLIFPLCGKAQVHTESNQSVLLNILGLEYVYEHTLDSKFTIMGRGGLAAGMEWSTTWYNDKQFIYLICPTVGLESRYYYNLEKRFVKGKQTANNSANFLSVQSRYYIPLGITSKNMNMREDAIMFSPSWGLRRIWNNKWMFEFNTGLNLWVNDFVIKPAVDVKFGFVL